MPPAPVIESVTTEDGACLAIKRRPTPGGPPVIFLHGLAVNADLWDLPEIRCPQYHYRSLAALAQAAGFDVWLVNLRGHGAPHMLSTAPPGLDDWCVDHFIARDLPAVVDAVRDRTGRRPLVIGASMGSMTLAGYLQGARIEGSGAEARVVAGADLAAARQAALAGAIFAEFPAALRWPESLYAAGQLDWRRLLRDWRRHDGDVNYPFEVLARWGWLQALVAAVGEVPLGWVGRRGGPPWYERLPARLAEGLARLERDAVEAMLRLAGTFTGGTSHRAEVLLEGRRFVFDHMKAGVLAQMAASVRAGAFVSGLGAPAHVYSDHYGCVTLPVLVVQGGRDRIANADVTRSAFFECIASTDRTWLFDEELAHGEIEAAPAACERLYPQIIAWMKSRMRIED